MFKSVCLGSQSRCSPHASCSTCLPSVSPACTSHRSTWRLPQVASTRLIPHAKKTSRGDEADAGGAAESVATPKTRKSKKATAAQVDADEPEPSTPKKGRSSKASKLEPSEPIQEDEEEPTLAPLTFTSSSEASMLDNASSVLEESVAKRKAGRRPRTEISLDEEGAMEGGEMGEQPSAPEPEAKIIISDEGRAVLDEIEPKPWKIVLNPELQPTNWAEAVYAEALTSQKYWDCRLAESKAIEERAWQSHHHQNRYAVNKYAMVRRVARIMAEVENYDFMREEKAPQHVPSWARAEAIFEREFDEFNTYVAENIEKIVKRYPKEAEEEELDILDDALFLLSRDDDSNALNQKVAQQTEDHLLVDRYLDNILPGVSLSSLSEAYADDIFAAEDDDDMVAVDLDEIGVVEGAAGKEPAAAAPAAGRKGRKTKKAKAGEVESSVGSEDDDDGGDE